MTRIAQYLLNALSVLLCGLLSLLWLQSYREPSGLPEPELAPGTTRVMTWRGEILFVRHRANVAPPWVWVKSWVSIGAAPVPSGQRTALVSALIRDPATPWDPEHRDAGIVWSHPYQLATLASCPSWKNLAGFGFHVTRLRLPRPAASPSAVWTWTESSPVLWSITIPLWLPLLLCAMRPMRELRRLHALRRLRRAGRCRGCGYDLRATPERCPECGAMAKEPRA